MVEAFAGKWKLENSEKFDDYLKELGVGMIKRKAASSVTQHVEITVNGNNINIKTTTTLSKQENDYTLGSKFKTPAFGLADGEYEAEASFADGKLTIHAVPVSTSLKETTITRELSGEQMIMTMTCGAVSCKRYFKRE